MKDTLTRVNLRSSNREEGNLFAISTVYFSCHQSNLEIEAFTVIKASAVISNQLQICIFGDEFITKLQAYIKTMEFNHSLQNIQSSKRTH